MESNCKSLCRLRKVRISSSVFLNDHTWCTACYTGDPLGALMLCVLSTTKCWLIVSTPHGAALAGCHVHVRDQSEQWRQFMLCSVCDHHLEGEGGGSDVRKQVVVAIRRCWKRRQCCCLDCSSFLISVFFLHFFLKTSIGVN